MRARLKIGGVTYVWKNGLGKLLFRNESLFSVLVQGWLGESMLQKSRARSKTKKYLHRNLGAGHIIPNEHYLERAGLRGRKAWCCWGAVLLALFVALGNLAVCCILQCLLVRMFGYIAWSGCACMYVTTCTRDLW